MTFVKVEKYYHQPPYSSYSVIYSNYKLEVPGVNFGSIKYKKALQNSTVKYNPKIISKNQTREEDEINWENIPIQDRFIYNQNPEVTDHVWRKDEKMWKWYCEKVFLY